MEDAGGSGEGGEVDGRREGGACLRHRRVAEKDKTRVGVFFCYYFYFPRFGNIIPISYSHEYVHTPDAVHSKIVSYVSYSRARTEL